MKWSVLVLIVMGLVAAFCVAMLTGNLRAKTGLLTAGPVEIPKVEIVQAATDLPAQSIVGPESIRTAMIPANEAPEGYVSSSQIIGKVLSAPVLSGQVFTKTSFVADGTGAHMASVLPKGMRAVGIALSDYSGMDSLLYPGCMVDVLVSFKAPIPNSTMTEAVSKTLFNNIEVLAIDDRTVLSGDSSKTDLNARGRRKVVTLMVTSRQAEGLQLAMEHGALSLAMRNPRDVAINPPGLSSLSTLAGDFFAKLAKPEPAPSTEPASVKPKAPEPPPSWEMTVIRGSAVEKRAFAMNSK